MAKHLLEIGDILNNFGTTYWFYYDKHENTFIKYDEEFFGPAPAHWVKLPFEENCISRTWENFRASLSKEDLALANSYEYRHGFFEFMRSNNLIDFFYKAQESARKELLSVWEEHNGLSINWETVTWEAF